MTALNGTPQKTERAMPDRISKTPPGHTVDPVAFIIALVMAPLSIAALGFWALLVPVFAVYFGAPHSPICYSVHRCFRGSTWNPI
jgi:fatty acid desaturase